MMVADSPANAKASNDPDDGTPAISVGQLRKKYGTLEAVRGIDLSVGRGEIFGLIGPDGAGKTTTFQILGGVMEATSGTVEIFGRSRPCGARRNWLPHSVFQSLS